MVCVPAMNLRYLALDRVEGREVAWNQVPVTADVAERLHSEVSLLRSAEPPQHHQDVRLLGQPQHHHINFITELFTSGTLRQ